MLYTHAEAHALPWGGLEKPPELYAAEELEHLFLRCKNVEVSLHQDTCSPLREVTLTLPSRIEDIHLLRSGRWALLRTRDGVIHYCDLEAPKIIPVLLIPSPFKSAKWICGVMAVDESRDAALLSFSVATFTEVVDLDWRNAKEDLRPRIDVYRVTLALDPRDDDNCFDIVSLSTFRPGYLDAIVTSIEVHGPHLARVICPNPILHQHDYIDVFDWAQFDQSEKPVRRYIVSEDKIVSFANIPVIKCLMFL